MPVPVRRPRLGLEAMEARDCPALFVWTGKWSVHFSGYTPQGTGGNWLSGPSWSSLAVPAQPPGPGDDVYYRSDYVQGYADCTWSNSVPEVKSLHIIKSATGAPYSGTVQMGSVLLNNGLELRTGSIAQGPGTTLTVTRSDIYTSSLWDGGVLNSSANVATVEFKNTPVTIDPTSGPLEHGSDIKGKDNAQIQILSGTVQTARDVTWLIGSGASLHATDANLVVTLAGFIKPIEVKDAGSKLGLSGTFSTRGLNVAGGTAYIIGPGKTTTFARSVIASNPPAQSVNMSSGALVIDNGATLNANGLPVYIGGGKLTTRAVVQGEQDVAVIDTPQLGVDNFGLGAPTDITISDTAYNATGDNVHYFGMLIVTGITLWFKGTYRPVVDGTVAANGDESTKADLWLSEGRFAVDGGAGKATLAPESVNNPAGGYAVGRTWAVLSGDRMSRVLGSDYPAFAPPAGVWGLQGVDNQVIWRVKRLVA